MIDGGSVIFLLLVGLIVMCVILWRDVVRLRSRVDELESAAWPRPLSSVAPTASETHPVPLRAPAVVIGEIPPQVAANEPVAVEPEPVPDEETEEIHPVRGLGFEELFGRRLPIWAGGVTLAVAGFLIVKYSIDTGLLSPVVRMTLGLLFGSALIAAAEAALRGDLVVRDPRVRQSLAGAGIATLYATILVAVNIYQLIGPLTAFIGMAVVTAAAVALSLRFGAPSAVLGLLGGLAAPALVGSGAPNVPLLASYLALTVGGLCAVSRQQRWAWLGAGALVGGFGWGILLLAGGAMDVGSTISLGILIALLGVAFPLVLLVDRGTSLRLAAGLIGCAQMAALVAIGGFAALHWALFGLISAAIIWLSRREAGLRHLPGAGLTIALLLAGTWTNPAPALLGTIIAGTGAIYGGAALLRLWRQDGSLFDAIQVAAIAAAILLLPMLHFYVPNGADDGAFALLGLLGSGIVGGAAALGWRSAGRTTDWRFTLLVDTACALLIAAMTLALPLWAVAPAGALVASGLLLFARRADDWRIAASAWGFAAVTLGLLLGGVTPAQGLRTVGESAPANWAQAVRWLVPAAMAVLFARTATWRHRSWVAQPVAVLLFTVAVAQVLAPTLLPLVPALLLVGLALAIRPVPLPAIITSWALVLLWALLPLLRWLVPGAESLVGTPFLSSVLPGLSDVALRLAIPAAAIALALQRAEWPRHIRIVAAGSAILLASIGAHVLFKQLLMVDSGPRFVALGYAERTLWEAQLAAAALLAWQWRARIATIALAAASFAHFLWFSLLLHNPLWSAQAVGAWLIPAYATALAVLWATARAGLLPALDRARDWSRMLMIPLLALSLLRWSFAGTILFVGEVSAVEDIFRSLLGALIAIGFLQWGIYRRARDWRIASLALMLATVAKVFLLDANGLDGLLRVASFAALGFSLIGIGWLYSRYLPDSEVRNGDHGGGTGVIDP